MADVRISCIVKPDVNSPHEHITHVGGTGWVWPRERVIASIEARENTFYVLGASGKRAEVGVFRQAGKERCLRTHADGYWNNNLLSLNQCPIR